jgi:CO/xanthine dehydrogenase FAD-binding subunit
VKLIGHPSTRSRGTIVGSMCHADPAAELPVCATVLDAEFVLQSTSGMRTLKSKEFFLDALTTAIAPNELAVEVRIPKAREKIGYAFVEIARRHGDFALVCAAAAVSIGSGKPADACVALGGIGSRPQLFNYRDFASAKQFSENELTGFANFIAGQVKPGSDLHATADYRRAISAALTKQAMATAMKRANIRSE